MVQHAVHVRATNDALADSEKQAQIREMHAQGTPLLEMVDALGLGGTMTAQIREALQDLPPDVVAGIRQATLEALDNGQTQLPIDCTMTEAEEARGVAVDVDVFQSEDGMTIRVRPSP
jgi:hypothetical protein